MAQIRIGEVLASLRKEKGITQETLARALGVSNQAVSKWEAGQCCPDITLLPDLASYFGVSTDTLLGNTAAAPDDLCAQLRMHVEELPRGEDAACVLRTAYRLHAVILSKAMTAAGANPGWNTEDAVAHAGETEWGYSCQNVPEITTVMRGGTVMFARGGELGLRGTSIHAICGMLRVWADARAFRAMYALYCLTHHDEDAYADVCTVAARAGMAEESVRDVFAGEIGEYLRERGTDGKCEYRIDGMYMHLIPLFSLLTCRG